MRTKDLPGGQELLMKDEVTPQMITCETRPAPDGSASVQAMFVFPKSIEDLRADMEDEIQQSVPMAKVDEAREQMERALASLAAGNDEGAEPVLSNPLAIAQADVGVGLVMSMTLGMN